MPSSIINTGIVASSFTDIVLATSIIGVSELGILGVVSLIILLVFKEILSASKSWNRNLASFLDMSIFPLFVVFISIQAVSNPTPDLIIESQ